MLQTIKYRRQYQIWLNIFVFVIIIFGLDFFQFRMIYPEITNLTKDLGGLICFIGFIIFYMKSRNKKVNISFGKTFSFFLISLIVSNFLCAIYWGQSLFISFTSEIPLLYILFYFVLHNLKIQKRFVLNLLKFIGIAYALCFLLNSIGAEQYFGAKESYEAYGVIKSTFPGRTFMYIAYFIILDFFLKKYKLINLLTLIFLLFVFVIMGRRTMLLSIIFTSFFLYYKHNNFSVINFLKFTSIIGLLTFLGFYYFESVLLSLTTKTQEQTSLGEDYIRIQSFLYYFFEFSPNLITNVFGNGIPSGRSEYGEFVRGIQARKSFFMADIGLIGFHVQFGVFATIAIYSMLLTFIKRKKEDVFLFAAVGVFFVPMSLLNVEIIRFDSFLAFSMLMYLFDTKSKRHK